MKSFELKEFLEEKVKQYNTPKFIESDPILIPHQYTRKEDIEISGFLTAIISWGQRKTIIKNATKLCALMDNSPFDFINNANEKELERFQYFVHRTFNGIDAVFFLRSLRNIYAEKGGLESLFVQGYKEHENVKLAISELRKVFFSIPHIQRTQKHFSNVLKNSSAKRINMFLRWMVRKDKVGVDFGIWEKIKPSDLYMPLDVHTGNVSRKLGLLHRKQDDWKAVEELTLQLRKLDALDPVKYDFALFGLGMYEKF